MADSLDVEQKVKAAYRKFGVYHVIWRKERPWRGSVYIVAAPSCIPSERSNHVLGVEEAEGAGCYSRQLRFS